MDDRVFIQRDSVERRILDAVAAGATEIVLTGGEPTLRADLPAIVETAKRAGARVILETNGAKLDCRALAGVDAFRVHVPAWGEALNRITRDPGAATALTVALAALVEAGATFEIATPIVRSNLGEVERIPDALVRAVGHRANGMILSVPTRAPDVDELVSFEQAAEAIVSVSAAAKQVGLSLRLAGGSGPPPCVFEPRRRPSHLYSLSGAPSGDTDHERIPACDDCRMRAACPGVARAYLDHFGPPNATPIRDDRSRRRLSLVGTVEQQIARELVSPGGRAHRPGEPAERIIRVNFHCNQACEFCFVSTHLPPATDDAVTRAIEEALLAGERIALSGGEPTLNPRLPDYLRLATRSPYVVELQTNAVRLDDRALTEALVGAGLSLAFVSLHGATAAISDAVTRAPGTFERTLRGLDNLAALGVTLRLNFVLCRSNVAELPDMIELVASRWPRASVSVSFVAQSTDVVPRDHDFLPQYTSVVPAIAEAIARGEARGIRVEGYESMCGLPLCLVPVPPQRHLDLPELSEDDRSPEFERPEPCARCSLSTRCFGVRRGYAATHGVSELRPIEATVRDAGR